MLATRSCFLVAVCALATAYAEIPEIEKNTSPETSETLQQWRFRKVTFEVRDVDGKPAPDVAVWLYGQGRDAVRGYEVPEHPLWNFVTDAQGRFTVEFGDFRAYDYIQAQPWKDDYEARKKQVPPAWGYFYLVTETAGTDGRLRRGVSPIICNEEADKSNNGFLERNDDDEWCKGKYAPVFLSKHSDNAPPVVIQLRRGIAVAGAMLDMKGRPMAGVEVSVYNDLYNDSHTGYGGAIFNASGTTDKRGRYRVENVFPNRFFVGAQYGDADFSSSVYWIKTRVRDGKWKEKIVDDITPRKGEKEIALDFIVSREPIYHYTGRVTDEAGKPVAGAVVTLAISRHWPERTYGDSHHWEKAETDMDGKYDLKATTRFCRYMDVESFGFLREVSPYREGYDGEKPFPPGSYDFQLKRSPEPLKLLGEPSSDGKWQLVGRLIDKEVGAKRGFFDWAFKNNLTGKYCYAGGLPYKRDSVEDEAGPSNVVPHWNPESRFVVVNLPFGRGRFINDCAIFRMDENHPTICYAPWNEPPKFFAAMLKEPDAKRISGQYKRFSVVCEKWIDATDFEIEYDGQVHLNATENEPEEWVSLNATATIRLDENGKAQIVQVNRTSYEKESGGSFQLPAGGSPSEP